MAEALAAVIDAHARTRAAGVAFLEGENTTSWAAYAERSRALARALLELGLARGERVAVILPDGAGVHVAFVATERAGLVAVGVGPRAGYREVHHLLSLSGAVALVTRREYRDEPTAQLFARLRADGVPLRHHLIVERDFELDAGLEIDGERRALAAGPIAAQALAPDDLWLLNSTSGTTGMPKCVMHHQDRWLYFHELAVEAGELRPDDVFMSVIPAPFGFGLWTAHFTPALLGAPCVLMERFTPEGMIAEIERRRVSVLAAVSTQFIMLLDALAEGRDLSSLRALFTGGERVPYARAAEFEQRTGASVLQFYGSNETGAVSRTRAADPRERRLRSAGRIIPEMQVRLFDAEGRDVTARGRGQPAVKGRAVSRGYWSDDAANRELIRPDGWVLLGDLVSIDADGWLTVEGRVGDFIIRGGKNISGPAVEEAAASHPAIRLAAAVAMPDPVFGERVCLFAERVPGARLTLAELTGHMGRLGASKEYLPERLEILSELPRSSGGKIAKQALREAIARRLELEAR
jgi:acyl-CoA synthetase